MEAFIPGNYWREHRGEVFIMGAGGSAIAITSYLLDKKKGDNIPSKLIVSNRSEQRLNGMKRIVEEINPEVPAEFYLTPQPAQNDKILNGLKANALIINATGLGKDRPGSPLTDTCVFPKDSLVWELNYRGKLDFMHQALAQKGEKNLYVEDGWVYFIHGWTQVISEVFHMEISREVFNRLEKAAMTLRSNA
jgi:shikimate 5-dehydrogenase